MTQRLTPALVLGDLAAATMLLTRLPLRPRPASADRTAAAVWCYPVIGAALGLAGAGVLWLGGKFGLPAEVAAAVALSVGILLTGALHEDGLADSADGLWGGRTVERRLEIMKDSRTGAYGVIAIALSLLLRWSALTALLGADPPAAMAALVLSGALSRAAMGAVWATLPAARPSGLAGGYGRPSRRAALVGAALAGVVALLCVPPGAALLSVLSAGLAAAWLGRIAWRWVGGQTGDVLGASQQLSEMAVLAALSALLG